MDIITFDKLLLKTAFCCMASDGNIDKRELQRYNLYVKNWTCLKILIFKMR
ncbi:hypothetical protein SAMN05660909_05354 [Chitinophaga terrae (ex Kim and Jung 2007)]|uniref:TerB family tellurite resistance protein n=1 Tax=Chitinophaga terrae (ex Kim and Jung 2007) TaxID=408074 RepID=A0A1H4GH18_9BACT|nr:hypothetical protein SAMN05660909_05354 [Chitinophaga terrae (ex Kim and Jung 2007)]